MGKTVRAVHHAVPVFRSPIGKGIIGQDAPSSNGATVDYDKAVCLGTPVGRESAGRGTVRQYKASEDISPGLYSTQGCEEGWMLM